MSGCRTVESVTSGIQKMWENASSRPIASANQVRASGTLHANEVRVASELGGRIERVYIEVGMPVHTGDPLVALDSTTLADSLAEAEARVSAAQADLVALFAEPQPQDLAVARAAVSVAMAERDGLQSALENRRQELENPQDLDAQIIEARTQLHLAEQAAILAEADLARETLLTQQKRQGTDERRITDYQRAAAERALAAAQADQAAAQALLDWLTYIRNEPLEAITKLHTAETAVRVAEANVRVAETKLVDMQAGPTLEQIAIAQGQVRLAEAERDVLQAQMEKYLLRSPLDGIVLSRVLYRGELAAPTATILVIANLDPIALTVYVPANQVGQIDLGQRVEVRVDSYPERSFQGQVTRIGNQPEFTPRNVATQEERQNTFYAVEISLPNPERALKPGMPADTTFIP